MRCLRCGWCCQWLAVIIVDDPTRGPAEGNVVAHMGGGKPCKHLRGEKPGEFECAVHGKRWYKQTPCYRHGQIERGKDEPCRMGVFQLKQERRKR